MIKINLVAEAPAAATAATKRKKPTVSLGAKQGDIILLVVLLLSALVVGGRWYLLVAERDGLRETRRERQEERNRLQEFITKVEELEKTRAVLKHRIEVIEGLKQSQQGPVRIMDEVSRALPDLVWLENLAVAGNTIKLTGRAMDENAVANYIANLDASPFFQEPSLSDMSRQVEGGTDTFKFVLSCIFTYSPEKIAGAAPADSAGGA